MKLADLKLAVEFVKDTMQLVVKESYHSQVYHVNKTKVIYPIRV